MLKYDIKIIYVKISQFKNYLIMQLYQINGLFMILEPFVRMIQWDA